VLDNYQLCFFPEEQWNELLQLFSDVARKFLRILSAELRYKDAHPPYIAYQYNRKRSTKSILRVLRHNNCTVAPVNSSRNNLASKSKIALETVSRILTEFKNEGLIQRKGSHTSILNNGKISSMKNQFGIG
jgi:CRP-like cAMP-binding protein